jgi:hypothetical protein
MAYTAGIIGTNGHCKRPNETDRMTYRDSRGKVCAANVSGALSSLIGEAAWTEDDPLERGAFDEDFLGLVLPFVPGGDGLAHA